MNVLLINSPLYKNPSEEYDEILPPLWLWYIWTRLKERWFNVEILDAIWSKLSLEEIIQYIDNGNFKHVWLNIFSTNHKLVEEIVIKTSKEISFLIWWAFTKSNYQDIIRRKTKNAITVVLWEGDYITWDIISWFIKEPPIAQLWNKKVFKVDKNSQYFPKDISNISLDRSLFKNEVSKNIKHNIFESNIISSRWCIYDCAFCSAASSLNRDTPPRIKDWESIKMEILEIIKKNPQIESIRILDDLFLRNKKSMEEAIQIFSGLNLKRRAMAHIQSFKNIDENLIQQMKHNWCDELSIWIESWNDDILQAINKKNTRSQIMHTIEKLLKSWIWVKWYFIIWFPDETSYQMEETYTLAKKLKEISLASKADFRISAFQFRPYHWTQLYNNLIKKWVPIADSTPTNQIIYKVGEYDFSHWNFSSESAEIISYYLNKVRSLNHLSQTFIPYIPSPNIYPHKKGIFFVWLSHKLWKKNNILEAFDWETSSWKILTPLINLFGNKVIYPTNLVKGVPLNENSKIRYPSTEEKKEWLNYLISEIQTFNPQIVFLFWKQVSDFVINNLWAVQINHNEYKYLDSTLIPVDHPSYIAVYKRSKTEEYLKYIKDRIIQFF